MSYKITTITATDTDTGLSGSATFRIYVPEPFTILRWGVDNAGTPSTAIVAGYMSINDTTDKIYLNGAELFNATQVDVMWNDGTTELLNAVPYTLASPTYQTTYTPADTICINASDLASISTTPEQLRFRVTHIDGRTLVSTGGFEIQTLIAPVLACTNQVGQIYLSWSAVPGADSYKVYTSTDGISFSELITRTSTSYTHTSAYSAGTKWYYIIPFRRTEQGPTSNTASGIGLPAAPNAFASFGYGQLTDANSNNVVTGGPDRASARASLRVSFSPPSNAAAAGVTGYRIYWSNPMGKRPPEEGGGYLDPVWPDDWSDDQYTDFDGPGGQTNVVVTDTLELERYYKFTYYCIRGELGVYLAGEYSYGGVYYNANRLASAGGGNITPAWAYPDGPPTVSGTPTWTRDSGTVTWNPNTINGGAPFNSMGIVGYNIYYNNYSAYWPSYTYARTFHSTLGPGGGTVTVSGQSANEYLCIYCVPFRENGNELKDYYKYDAGVAYRIANL